MEGIFVISFLIISIFGTLLHFTHGWFKKGLLLHFFSAVNESTWEHMKMLIAPTIVVSVYQYFTIGNEYENLLNSLLILFIVELISIPILYEISKLIFKSVHFVITIVIFYLSILFGLISEHIVLNKGYVFIPEYIALILVVIIIILFNIFTFYPPKLGVFKDPVKGRYGHR